MRYSIEQKGKDFCLLLKIMVKNGNFISDNFSNGNFINSRQCKYKSDLKQYNRNPYLNCLIDPNFQGVKRLFA